MTDNRQDTCGWKTMLTRHKGDIKKQKKKNLKSWQHICVIDMDQNKQTKKPKKYSGTEEEFKRSDWPQIEKPGC